MTHIHIDTDERRALRAELRQRLDCLDWEVPVTRESAQAALERLPRRQPGEALATWLQRCYRLPGQVPDSAASGDGHAAPSPAATDLGRAATTASVIPFRPSPKGRLQPLAEALAWAAAEQGTGPVALPERLEVGKDAFEIAFSTRENGRIRVRIQALGWTLAELQGEELAVTGPAGLDQLLALVTLDALGEGAFEVPDNDEVRRMLLNLHIGRVEPA